MLYGQGPLTIPLEEPRHVLVSLVTRFLGVHRGEQMEHNSTIAVFAAVASATASAYHTSV
jgi:hypothetical protein